jgi:hypothetical protein
MESSLEELLSQVAMRPISRLSSNITCINGRGANGVQNNTTSSDCRSSINTDKEPTTTPNNVYKESLQPLTRTVQSSNNNDDDDDNGQPERTITPATINNVQEGISSAHKTVTTTATAFHYDFGNASNNINTNDK